MGKTTGFITETDCYLFGEGTHYEIYNKLGAHPTSLNGKRVFTLLSGRHMPHRSM